MRLTGVVRRSSGVAAAGCCRPRLDSRRNVTDETRAYPTAPELLNTERFRYMAVDVDYYALLRINRDADTEAIETAVKKAMREWRKRTEAADLSVRQEAELKVKQIEEARTTLLNQGKRAAYDRDLAGGVRQTEKPDGSTAPGGNWLDQAESYLAAGDYHSASYAARQATQAMGDSARSWWVRSRANAGLNVLQDALYEARQAVALEENNADYHFNLGLVYEGIGQYNDAINAFRGAGSCDPSNPMYELAVGGVYLQTGNPKQALSIIEAVHRRHPQDENANYYLGSALLELAESVPKVRNDEQYVVTSAEEIHQMRSFATRAKSLKIVDAEIHKNADYILRYLDDMEKMTFRPPWDWGGRYIDQMRMEGAERGCAGLFAAGILIVGFMLLPLILLISSFGAFGAGSGGWGFMLLLAAAGSCWYWYKRSWIPAWKRNSEAMS